VVSSSDSIQAVQNAIFAFIDSVPTLLQLLPAETYRNHVNSQISEKQRADPSLYDAASFNWYEITEGRMDFTLRSRQVEYLKDENLFATKQLGLKAFAETLLLSSRRLLLVQSSLKCVESAPLLPASFAATFGREAATVFVAKEASEVHSQGSVVVPR
jgi:secreted Zn-dependent insulinase-like peptidase